MNVGQLPLIGFETLEGKDEKPSTNVAIASIGQRPTLPDFESIELRENLRNLKDMELEIPQRSERLLLQSRLPLVG